MGLPSGVQWASCNVGAEKDSEFGLFFSWGNIEGHREGEGYDFTQSVYDSTPAASINTDLSLNQDAARVNMGEPWRMPTDAEFQELVDNCTNEWATVNGVNGMLFTSNVNGNKLFFPAAGRYNGTSLVYLRNSGYVWSSTFYNNANAHNLYFDRSSVNPQNSGSRYFGLTVRAVIKPT